MSLKSKIEYINTLQHLDLAIEEKEQEKNQVSIWINILIFLGGVVANLAFILFLFTATEFDEEIYFLACSVFLLALTLIIGIKYDKQTIQTFITTTYFTGLSCLAIYLVQIKLNPISIYAIILLVNAFALYLLLSPLIKFIATLSIIACLNLIVYELFGPVFLINMSILWALALIWMYKKESLWFSHKKLNSNYSPVIMAIQTWVLLKYLVDKYLIEWDFLDHAQFSINSTYSYYIALSLIYATFLFVIYDLVKNQLKVKINLLYFIPLLLFLAASYYQINLLYGLMFILLAYQYNDKLFLIASGLFFTLFLGTFYYDLQTTLLYKSLLLLASGLFFIIQYFIIQYAIKNEQQK